VNELLAIEYWQLPEHEGKILMASDLVSFEKKKGIGIVQLSHKTTNAISMELVEALAEIIETVKKDELTKALVLTSANEKFLSIGFDIPSLLPLEQEQFTAFYRAFNQLCIDLYTLPKPTVAAITGHAIAGGCILALCCDERIIAEGRKLFGLNEVKLGVPVPYVADRILHALVGARLAREVMEVGEFYPAEDAVRLGLVDHAHPLDQVLDKALEQARMLAVAPGDAFALIKANRVEGVMLDILERLEVKQMRFIECWYADAARKTLKDAGTKF
jgi:enoyl-CoA hydratase/carnithine racemase